MKRSAKREFGAVPMVLAMLGALALILWPADAGLWVWLAVGIGR